MPDAGSSRIWLKDRLDQLQPSQDAGKLVIGNGTMPSA